METPVAADVVTRPVFSPRSIVLWALLIAGPMVVAGAAAFGVAHLMPSVYAARTDLVFDTPQRSTTEEFRSTQAVIIAGRSILGPVSESTDIAVETLEKNLSVDFPKGGMVMRIQYADRSDATALSVVEAVLDQYVVVLGQTEGFGQPKYRLLVPPFVLERPVQPRPLQAAALGLAFGLSVGLGAAALAKRMRWVR